MCSETVWALAGGGLFGALMAVISIQQWRIGILEVRCNHAVFVADREREITNASHRTIVALTTEISRLKMMGMEREL